MRRLTNRSGFGAVSIIIIIAVVLAVVALGWFAWQRFNGNESTSTTDDKATSSSVEQEVNPINNQSELDAADAKLQQTDSANNDNAQLEQQLQF